MRKITVEIYNQVEAPTPNGIKMYDGYSENSEFVLDKVNEICKKYKRKPFKYILTTSKTQIMDRFEEYYYHGGGFYSKDYIFGGQKAYQKIPQRFYYYQTIINLIVYLQ